MTQAWVRAKEAKLTIRVMAYYITLFVKLANLSAHVWRTGQIALNVLQCSELLHCKSRNLGRLRLVVE